MSNHRWAKVAGKAGRPPGPRNAYKNKTEDEYAERLFLLKLAGEIQGFDYEADRLKIGAGAWYTPDFRVVLADGTIEFHEVKGFWREAAKVRIKAAAHWHPYRFVAVKKKAKKLGGGWGYEEF